MSEYFIERPFGKREVISVAIGGTRFVIPQPTTEQVAAAKLQDLGRSKG